MKNNDLQKIYQKYYNELYLYTFSLCKNHSLTEELVSDAFFKAFTTLETSNTHIKYWLFRVSKNLWIDYIRKRKHIVENTSNSDTLTDRKSFLTYADSTLENIINNETKLDLYAAIMTLPDHYKEVIILFYFCNFSLKDIAASLDTTSGATRTLLYRARNKLEKILKDVM